MKKVSSLVVVLLLLGLSPKAQKNPADTIEQRIILIGDAGQLNSDGTHHVVDAVRNTIPLDSITTVFFLGDNLYRNGLPDVEYTTYGKAKAILDSQISLVDKTKAKLYMIPGNHDWENGGPNGFNAILRQQLYVSFINTNPNVKYLPEEGCPGPVEIPIGDNVTVIAFDSQWWLHPYDKPELESDCDSKTTDEVVNQIADIAAKNANKLVILACHHPFKSNGIHGGYFTLTQHIFPLTDMKKNLYIPLPILGSIYPISRSVFGTPQDMKHPVYANMIKDISTAIKKVAPNLVFVSGHDHNLQLIRDSSYNYIVSGGGCKQNRTSKSRKSLFNSRSEGFAVMEVSTNKNVTVTFYTVSDSVRKSQTFSLLNFSKPAVSIDSTKPVTVDDPFLKYKDTTSKPATEEFYTIKGMRRFFMGQNYRAEWGTPVNMRVFNLNKERGGFKITGLGGGKQTQTLHLKDKKGVEWVLRTVDKNPSQTIPEGFRGNLANYLMKELKSASYPYGALIVPGLTKPLGLAATDPELFFVPDDPALGFYRDLFANKVCMLEKKDASFDGSNTKTTNNTFNETIEDNDHRPVQQEVLKARLLDIVIADYDRHLDQWRWDVQDTGKGKIYYPIPRDRDQAFFYSDGALLRSISNRKLPFLKGFRPDIPKVDWLGYSARDFDRLFLTELDANKWKESIAELQEKLSDSVIRKAVHRLPQEIFRINGEKIIDKMISRRNLIPEAAMKYFRFISRKVNVLGSNQKEYFKVSNAGDGKLQVRVYARSRNDTSFIMYDRVFDPSVTKEIRLFGLNDKDVFEVEPDASSRIKLRIIGGQENDTFDIKGNVEALLYDVKDTGNYIKNQHKAKNRFSTNSPVNEKTIFGFNYNYSRFPQIHFNYNSDDGFLAGAAFSRRTFGFRNLPYASDQKLSAIYSFTRQAIQFRYRGEFNHITRNFDLLLLGNVAAPALQNFLGFGNTTRLEPGRKTGYYLTRYNTVELEALIRQRMFDKFHIMGGPYYYNYSASYLKNRDNVLGKPSSVRLDSADIFSRKAYLGVKLVMLIDNRNNEFFPTRGVHWLTEYTGVGGIKKGSNSYMAITSDMTVNASLSDPAKLVAILKLGGGHIFTGNYEYFQAISFGANTGLNGFRKNRYSGRSVMYGGLELKIKLMTINSYILPGTLGFNVFAEAGRARASKTDARRWHTAYGVGLYYLPFDMFAITGSVGFSGSEKMLSFSLGTKINLSY